VKELLVGEISGGSIGGDCVITAYDTLNSRHVLGVAGYVGGFGGEAEYVTYYDYSCGTLVKVASFESVVYFDDDEYKEYNVNEKAASKEQYEETAERFIEPTEPLYCLPRR